jgi:presenilin-like A22 family membrane protease
MTFVIVLLYKYRCMKILITYMVVATGMLLGYISSIMFQVAIDRYSLTIDKVSFWLFIYNFAIVGTLAIFFGRGFPVYVQQGYLIANSVIVAWQLSYFDSWTAWALLIMLALYDLFAVLSPCGPLKALVKLMQRDNAPEMPGLLYEASLPQQQQQSTSNPNQHRPPYGAAAPPTPEPHPSAVSNAESTVFPTGREQSDAERASASTADESSGKRRPYGQQGLNNKPEVSPGMDEACQSPPSLVAVATATGDVELAPLCMTNGGGDARDEAPSDDGVSRVDTVREGLQQSLTTGPVDVDAPPVVDDNSADEATQEPSTAHIPLALARMYKLRLVDNPRPRWMEAADQRQHQSSSGDVDEEDPQPPAAVVEPEYTPEELNSLVHVVFPTNGGRIQAQEPQPGQANEPVRYDVLDRHGVVRRTLVVRDGRVFRVVPVEVPDDDDADGKRARNSIKLGLGDFIFYSILVAEAAVYSYTTFVACTLVILDGLGMTLVLLAVYGKALPALPISIFLGVIFYLLTRYLIQPWIQSIFVAELYV